MHKRQKHFLAERRSHMKNRALSVPSAILYSVNNEVFKRHTNQLLKYSEEEEHYDQFSGTHDPNESNDHPSSTIELPPMFETAARLPMTAHSTNEQRTMMSHRWQIARSRPLSASLPF